MIPPSVRWSRPGLVVLVRRDDRGAGALDRWRRVGDDDVEALVRQLEVVAAVGDDDPAVRVGEDRPRRPGSTSRTSSGRSGRARRRRSEARDERAAERRAHPERDDERAGARPGRAMSGRTGISLASMVSSVIDVPATHSSGVAVIWPAWTDAISSSVDSKSLPPTDSMYATPGWTRTPGRIAVDDDRDQDDGATPAMSGRSVSVARRRRPSRATAGRSTSSSRGGARRLR